MSWQRQAGDTAGTQSSSRIPISKNYLLVYPDGSRKHIGRAERDDLLLSGMAKQTAPQRYLFTGQKRTLHSFAELSTLKLSFTPENHRRFLPGSFIFEHEGKRYTELMETPEGMAMRMSNKGDNLCQDQQ